MKGKFVWEEDEWARVVVIAWSLGSVVRPSYSKLLMHALQATKYICVSILTGFDGCSKSFSVHFVRGKFTFGTRFPWQFVFGARYQMSVPMYSCSVNFVEGNRLLNSSAMYSGINEVVTAPGDDTKSSSTLRPREKRTLWVGDLDRAEGIADEAYVKTHMFYEFANFITGVRICRDKITRQPSFGFVEFLSEKEAQYVLEHMNGRYVPGRHHKYRLNWATFNLNEKPEPRTTFSRPAQLNRTKQDEQQEGKRSDIPSTAYRICRT